jgi:hypothetical protein
MPGATLQRELDQRGRPHRPGMKEKPTWHQVSASDRMIHPETERRMAKRMNPQDTIGLGSSRASLAAQPSTIVDWASR